MSKKASIWSLELLLVVGIPALTVVAGLITVIIASSHGFTNTDQRLDRFGQTLEQSS